MSLHRFVALDRDGTLIVERNYLSDPSGVELLPGVSDGLREMRELGLGLIVVTNQSGIGRGYFDRSQMDAVHARMNELLAAAGIWLDGIYACPHVPDELCECRKPRAGLLVRAASEHGFVPGECIVIGDKLCDIGLGQSVGAITVLVRTGYGASVAEKGHAQPNYIVDDLVQAAELMRRVLFS